MKRVLVVGCGFAGAVYARTLADQGYGVDCIDQRSHVAGNAYDYLDHNGVRVHKYGPHIFHTNNQRVFDWLAQFADFVPYRHKVAGLVGETLLVPFPINRTTLEKIYGVQLQNDAALAEFLRKIQIPHTNPSNAAEMLESKIGAELTDLFYRRYSEKMWDRQLEEIHASVVARVNVRFDREDRYFLGDSIEVLPRHGFHHLVQQILSHKNISITLNCAFSQEQLNDYDHCFNSMAIDQYYDYCFGELPYRSMKFHHQDRALADCDEWSVINFTDKSIFTRESRWHNFPCHYESGTAGGPQDAMSGAADVPHDAIVSVTQEQPCDYKENNWERYYPIKTSDDRYGERYRKYRDFSAKDQGKMQFIGRCGTYQYLDMHQVINQSLAGVQRWLLEDKK